MLKEEKVKEYQNQLLRYWDCCGRKELPWRNTSDPWKILVTEILLRKTTANQVLHVYETFSTLTPSEFANFPEDDLLKLLLPLGMYRIKSTLLRYVAKLVEVNGVEELKNYEFLDKIPGIGKYIQNAILCFAFGEKKPALDTNMIRIIQRVFTYVSTRSRPREDPHFWLFAEELVSDHYPKEYNWAVLDLAYAICKPKNPNCPVCPLMFICDYANQTKTILVE